MDWRRSGLHLAIVPTVNDTDGRHWGLYQRAFDDLRVLAVQRHIMVREEFDTVMADDRVDKYVLTDADDTKSRAAGDYANFRACRS